MDSALQGADVLSYSPLQLHNERNGVSNHRLLDGVLNRLFRRRSKKISKLCVTGLRGIHRSPVDSPHKGPVVRKIFPFNDVIMVAIDADQGPSNISIYLGSNMRLHLNRSFNRYLPISYQVHIDQKLIKKTHDIGREGTFVTSGNAYYHMKTEAFLAACTPLMHL